MRLAMNLMVQGALISLLTKTVMDLFSKDSMHLVLLLELLVLKSLRIQEISLSVIQRVIQTNLPMDSPQSTRL